MLSNREITVVGAGVIGLSLALELHARGARVTLWEQGTAAAQASWAAAGMLAAQDPHNPPALRALADLSLRLYPAYLRQMEERSGFRVPFQTDTTFQTMPDGTVQRFEEHSIDPRQLSMALVTAVQRAGIPLRRVSSKSSSSATPTRPTHGLGTVVYATGAWAAGVSPRKGQMLRVQLPPDCGLTEVYRAEGVYVVPRTQGSQAGTALIGATVEDAGFDTATCADDLASLRHLAAELVPHHPELGDPHRTPIVEAWAGLRPASPDELPMLGPLPQDPADRTPPHFIAAGHFRNGILLAPVTAVLLADLIDGREPGLDLGAFSPARFASSTVLTP